jgi:capsular exopolysaccharide synthesis family protein
MDQPQRQFPPPGSGQAIVESSAAAVPQNYRLGANPYPYFPNVDTETGEQGFDFWKYVRIALKYRWLITGIVLTSLLVAAVLTFLMTPIYRATASLQIDRETMNIVKVDGVQPDEGTAGMEFFQTQYELLASRALAERVVTTLGLGAEKTFNVKNKSILDVVKALVMGEEEGSTAEKGFSQEDVTRAGVDRLIRSLSVAPVRGSRIVKVSVDHPNPAMAQTIANGYADVFIADNLDRRFEATAYARKFLEGRLQQLKSKLEDSEKQLVRYAEEQGIIRLDDNKSLSASDLQAINDKLAEVRSDRIKKELVWKQAQSTDGLGLKEILDSDAIKANRKLRTELAAEYQQKLAIYKPAFPLMVQLRNQIKELDRQVQTEVAAIKNSLEASYLAAKEEEETLIQQLEGSKAEVVDQRNRSIQYNILQREVDTNRSLYDGLLQRYKEIGVAGGVGTNNISIVDRAIKPGAPRSPNLLLNMGLAFVVGVLLGVMAALGLDLLDDSFKSPEDIEREFSLAVMGIIPKPRAGRSLDIELSDPRSGIAEAYRSLRTGLQFATSEGLPRSILVTSSQPAEGKSTTAHSLAVSLAQIGLNVLLIDADLRNASLHRRLRISNEVGLSSYLSGAKLPEEVVQASTTEGLVLMTSGPLPPNPAELLTGARMPSLLTLAAESFDIVIVDSPPIMGLADAPLLSRLVQATMLVVAANETRRRTARIALKRLQMARANVIGALLNKFDAKETGYGYGYGYGDYDYHSYGNTPQLPSARS